jgi:hypothetical protein
MVQWCATVTHGHLDSIYIYTDACPIKVEHKIVVVAYDCQHRE